MKIENIKCLDYRVNGDKLVVTVSDTTRDEIRSNLFNKNELNVYADNEETLVLCDTLYGFIKPVSITENIENGNFTVIVKQVSELEERVTLIEEAFNEMLFSEEVIE